MPILLFKNQMQSESRLPELHRDGKVFRIPTTKIVRNPSQPRKSFDDSSLFHLADSIRRYGLLQPLSVREEIPGERYELIAGERRYRACCLLGMTDVPCLIAAADKRQSAELALIENLQRQDLNMFEEATAIGALLRAYGMTQEEVAMRLAVSQSYVANKLRLLRLTDEEQTRILDGNLTERHARALLRLGDPEKRKEALDRILKNRLNVSATEAMVEQMLSRGNPVLPQKKARLVGVIKDIRLFYNSLENAVSIIRRSGIDVKSERREFENEIEVVIRIPRPKT